MQTSRHCSIQAGLLICCLICYCHPLPAQDAVVYNRDKSLRELTLAPSPEASTVTRYADIPFTYSTGMAELSIPIYTIEGRDLSIPISLSYRSGGIKVSEVAGAVGLGWSLQAGGCITREVVFLPDEYRYNGYAFYQQPSGGLLDSLVNQVNCTATREYLTSILWNQKDCSSDRYSYNVCGLSGTFVFTPGGEIVHLSGDGCLVEAHRAIGGAIESFTLTGPDGTIYTLADKETGSRYNVELNPTPMSGAQIDWSAPTAWYVSSITSADGLETASFSYSSGGTWVCNTESTSYSWTATTQGNAMTYTGHHGPSYNTDSRDHDVLVLSSISLRGSTVQFTYAAESGHADYAVPGHILMNNYPRRLTGIRVSVPGHSNLFSVDVGTGHGDDGRIVLQSLLIKRNGILDDRWAFSYEPSTVSNYFGQDWFGYSNGESSRTDLVPYSFPAGNGAPVLSYGYPDPACAKGGMLIRADHDGAVTEFEYEGNAVGSGNTSSSIGVRVKRIKVYDGDNLVRVRSFSYTAPFATAGYYPIRTDYTTTRVDQRIEYHPLHPDVIQRVLYDWTFTLHDSPVAEGASLAASRVIYGHVVEDAGSDTLMTGGSQRTEYWFKTSGTCAQTSTIDRFPTEWSATYTQPSFLDYVPAFYREQFDRGVGLLTRKVVWKYVGEGGSPISIDGYEMAQSEDWTYAFPTSSSVLTGYMVHQIMHRVTAPGGDVRYVDLYHYPVWSTTQPDLSSSTVTRVSYHLNGSDTTMINALYAPRPSLTIPNRISTLSTSVGGRSRNLGYTYPDTWGTEAPAWVQSLSDSHRLNRPIQQSFYYGEPGRSGATPFVLDLWKIVSTQYDYVFVGDALRLMPVSRIETTGEAQAESWREEILGRDCMGNVTSIAERGCPQTIILWSYAGHYPVAMIENATLGQVQSAWGGAAALDSLTLAVSPSNSQLQRLFGLRTLLPQAHVRTYTYEPGIGMTSSTSISGMRVLFEYDAAGRLSTVKDADGHVMESYSYSLLNEGDDRRSIRHRLWRDSAGSSYAEDVTWWNTLGLHVQDIAIGASGDGRDLVSAYEGDFMLHDDVRSWLPYPVQGSQGAFQPDATQSSVGFHGHIKAFMAKGYEVSERNRVVSSALPGFSGTHETTVTEDVYRGMQAGMPVLEWNNGGVVKKGTYAQKELIEVSTVDADGRRVSITKDHAGRTLALAHGPASHTPTVVFNGEIGAAPTVLGDPLPTLYVYDSHDLLRAVIGSGIECGDTLNMWRYGYDTLGRLSSKGIPGAAREYYAYDDNDRIVSISRTGEFIENVYDAFGRVREVYLTAGTGPRTLIEEHFYDSYPDSASALLSLAASSGVYPEATTGLETCSRLAQVDGNGDVDGYCTTVVLYDGKERPLCRLARFPDGIVVLEKNTFNYPGEVIASVTSVIRGSASDSLSVSYEYDQRGRVTSSTSTLIPDGDSPVSVTTQYGYDALGRASLWNSSSPASGGVTLSRALSYTLQGWMASNTVSAGLDTILDETLLYNGSSLPSGTTPSYTGLVTARSMVFQNPGDTALPKTERYSYDYAGRLTAENGFGMNIDYAYDTRGNLLSVEETPKTGLVNAQYDKYSYSYSGDRLTSIGQDHFSRGGARASPADHPCRRLEFLARLPRADGLGRSGVAVYRLQLYGSSAKSGQIYGGYYIFFLSCGRYEDRRDKHFHGSGPVIPRPDGIQGLFRRSADARRGGLRRGPADPRRSALPCV